MKETPESIASTILALLILAVLLFFVIRPIMRKYYYKPPEEQINSFIKPEDINFYSACLAVIASGTIGMSALGIWVIIDFINKLGIW